jgi:hypothetical protein
VLPTHYPARLDLEATVKIEHGRGLLDNDAVAPRLQAVYN